MSYNKHLKITPSKLEAFTKGHVTIHLTSANIVNDMPRLEKILRFAFPFYEQKPNGICTYFFKGIKDIWVETHGYYAPDKPVQDLDWFFE